MSYPANARSATVNASTNGANTVIAAVPGKVIRVISYVLVCASAVNVTWESDGGTILGGPMPFAANGGAAPPKDDSGMFDTLSGEGLVLFLSSGVQVGGHVKYVVGL